MAVLHAAQVEEAFKHQRIADTLWISVFTVRSQRTAPFLQTSLVAFVVRFNYCPRSSGQLSQKMVHSCYSQPLLDLARLPLNSR
jgi:hypothetical protein